MTSDVSGCFVFAFEKFPLYRKLIKNIIFHIITLIFQLRLKKCLEVELQQLHSFIKDGGIRKICFSLILYSFILKIPKSHHAILVKNLHNFTES